MRTSKYILPVAAALLVFSQAAGGAEQDPSELQRALRSRDLPKAFGLIEEEIRQDPKNPELYYAQGRVCSEMGRHDLALKNFSKAIELKPDSAGAYQHRGEENFILAQIPESIADFNKVIELRPEQEPHHWQRGISYYYAGEFAKGRKQFEMHQTVNSSDVENAVWHFLCVAREKNVEEARKTLIPITGDTRVPMKQIHDLFAGKIEAAAVIDAAKVPGNEALEKTQLCYAYLYLGLYEETLGHREKSLEYIRKAAIDYSQNHYMGNVAKVHLLLRAREK